MQPLVVSYSEISAYQKCPLMWSMEWRDRWRKPATPGGALDMGTATHEVLAEHYQSLMETQGGELSREERANEAAQAAWNVYQGHPLEDYLSGMYKRYVAQWGIDSGDYPDPAMGGAMRAQSNWEILGVEQQGEFKLGYVEVPLSEFSYETEDREVRVKWIADLIVKDHDLDGIMVWDHKTCSQLRDDKSLQWDSQLPTYTIGAMLEHPDWTIIGGGHNEIRKPKGGVYGPNKTSVPWGRRTLSQGLTAAALKELADNMLATVQEMVKAPERPRYSPSTQPTGCAWCSVEDVHDLLRQHPKEKVENLLIMNGFEQQKDKLQY